jgi:hypothetical protein
MKRRRCLALAGGLLGTLPVAGARAQPSAGVQAQPSAAEQARIERLLDAVAKRTDIRFVRNGRDYSGSQAAEFLRGKLGWRLDKVATVQDFIEQVGTRSTTSGDVYRVRLADGRVMTSADFLRQELKRIEPR